MKRYLKLMLFMCILILGVSPIFAVNPSFLVLDQNKSQVTVVGSDFKPLKSFKAGSCPSEIVSLNDNSGSLLLCRGSKNMLGQINQSGSLVYLDNQLNPTAKKYSLPGLVVQDFYYKDTATWILITQNNKEATAPASATIYDLKTGQAHIMNLNSIPTAYRFNAAHTLLALTTIGNSNKKAPIQAQLVVIDLIESTMKSFAVSPNPGEIYFINDTNLIVACSGFRPGFKYTTEKPLESFEKAHKASLHWIDTVTSEQKVTDLGYSPLVIIQDQADTNTFYVAYNDSVNEKEVKGIFHKLINGKILSEVKIAAEPVSLQQVKSGNICLTGREEFFIINQDGAQILTEEKYPLKVDELILNPNQTIGYLSVFNSGNSDIFDMVTGHIIKKLKIRPALTIPLNLADLFPSNLPPVGGLGIPKDDIQVDILDRKQIILSPDQKSLYLLASQYQFSNVDIETGNNLSITKFSQGKPNGIYITANQKYIVVTTNTNCFLIDPLKNKPVLNFEYSLNTTGNFPPEVIYGSPDGNTLIIPNNSILYIIDCQNGKLINKLYVKTPKVKLAWIN